MEAPNRIEAEDAQKDLTAFDRNLRLVWNPNALLLTPGRFDAYGAAEPSKYGGRYQVVVKGAVDGEDTVILTLGEESDPSKPYRAPGPWLIQYLREWDTANAQFAESMQKMVAEDERSRKSAEVDEDERNEEATHRFAFEHGARELIGRGADFKH